MSIQLLAISGFFDYVDALKIISVRGEAMQESVENSDTGMAAVLTTDLEATLKEIEALNSQDIEVWISNYNDASQIVISSSNENLEYLKSNSKALVQEELFHLKLLVHFIQKLFPRQNQNLLKRLEQVDAKRGNNTGLYEC